MKKINWDKLMTIIMKKGILVWSIWYAMSTSNDIGKNLLFILGLNISITLLLYLFNLADRIMEK